MKQLTCEMCGSTDLMKQDGVFVCQTCGCKYSVEEAKKLMIDGIVEVTGKVDVSGSTVKVDKNDEVKNYKILARRAFENENYEKSNLYYTKILNILPNDWEAIYYDSYIKCLMCKGATHQQDKKIVSKAILEMGTVIDEIIILIKDFDDKEILRIFNELVDTSIKLIIQKEIDHKGIWVSEANNQSSKMESILALKMLQDMHYFKDINSSFSNKHNNLNLVTYIGEKLDKEFIFNDQILIDRKKQILKKCKDFDNKYFSSEVSIESSSDSSNANNSGGCYVATAVYGSYDCLEVWTLRRYRDNQLAKTWYGRLFIHIYYAISPTIVKWFGNTDWFKKMWKGKLDKMVSNLQLKGIESTPYEDKKW